MRINELLENNNDHFIKAFEDFLPLAMGVLELQSLPKIKIVKRVEDKEQPTFGKFINQKEVIQLAIENRHVIDILRTLAHELAHYKQKIENRLNPASGETGSPEENEAHTYAGIIMRNFNKKYPNYMQSAAIVLDEDWKKKLGVGALIGAGLIGSEFIKKPHDPPEIRQQSPEALAKLPTQFQNQIKNELYRAGVTGVELAQFLAQVAHETANFTSLEELPDSSGDQYFYKRYWYNERVRNILGNKSKEDAVKYKGRGLFHLTGRYNYEKCGKALGVDLVNNPQLAADPSYQVPIALWFWKNRVVRRMGDDANFADTAAVTYFINKYAGPKNISNRDSKFKKYLELLNLSSEEPEKQP